MEKQYFVQEKGQALQMQDLDLVGETSALADDRVLAELLRMAPMSGGDVAKAVLPSGCPGGGATFGQSIVKPATGAILVAPFRAIVGSRTDGDTDAVKGWRDIRSGVFASGADGHPGGPPEEKVPMLARIPLDANGGGDPRWDLVYARVDVDLDADGVVRLIKDPTSMVVTAKTIAPYKITKVTVGVEPGLPAPTPALPPLPSDAGGAYYIPLAYVRVESGFGGGTALSRADIWEVAPVVTLAQAVGVAALKPANQHHVVGGTLVGTWPMPSGPGTNRPDMYIPPTMVGGESRFILIDLEDVTTGSVIDDSVDWRNRFFRCTYLLQPGPVATKVGAGEHSTPTTEEAGDSGVALAHSLHASTYPIMRAVRDTGSGSETVMLKVSPSTGELICEHDVTPGRSLCVWLEASAPYEW